MAYTRKEYHTLRARIQEPRKFIHVLAGPRQVGKSTLVGQILQELIIPYSEEVADAVDPKDSDWIRRVWEGARTTMRLRGEQERLLVIDEIQKINNWSEVVKREWDEDTRNHIELKVVLLGSSRLLLKKGLTESLAGRFELIRLGHWSYQEMHEAFGTTLEQYIYFGGYPGAAHLVDDEKRWRKYIKDSLVTPSIEKDVLMTSTIYKPALMKQLFELGCSYSAEILSLTKLMGQLQDAGNVTTLASYRGRSLQADRTDPTLWGRWVESAVGAHLIGSAEEMDYQVFYWRESAKSRGDKDMEVDFVIVNNGEVTAIEVKSGRRSMNSGLPAFMKAFHPHKSFVVGIGGVSIEDFLSCDIEALLN